ncbi:MULTISPECIES: DUF6851 domain-containing protein [unclassified Streptomyces]|uniref:DUF6851 domain-containing protein n=1 Tax=unclassified Streptomyces TaxID=2593676 RepID=UPI000AA78959|nr:MULTISPECIES: hypothetical protein [unclassified Streptomyces]AZM59186.1 hypothetical protein DLM49_06115 [Streptomyces sp. WAC 01438]RSM96706.1 hypothetical protein DMA10_12650 [Streptomyces sp. WAC 01420]
MAIATATALTGTLTSAVTASPQQAAGFDFDHGNAVTGIIYMKLAAVSRANNTGSSPVNRDSTILLEVPWFDAIAPYHPTAVGIFSDLGRRPSSEHTTRNKNIAVMYSAFTSLNVLYPEHRAQWREMMESAGLDPDDTETDPATPSGIGILAAKNAFAARKNDGSNRDGSAGGRRYHRQPYADYTGYKPVNSAEKLRDPSRWQPNTFEKNGVFTVQKFATPHFGRVKPFTYDSPSRFKVSPPRKSNHRNHFAYKRQADEVLRASAHLDDRRKMTAELFNSNFDTFGLVGTVPVIVGGKYDVEKTIHYTVVRDIGFYDLAIATWHFKRKYDSVRPFSAIRHLYGKKKVTAWGGPGEGTVNDITGNEWRAYLDAWPADHPVKAPDHPEYPSAEAAECLAFAHLTRRFTGTDALDISHSVSKGSSFVEPGITPGQDMTLRWSNLTDFARDCGESRLWGGQNFRASIEAAAQYAPQIGDLAYEYVQRKVNGG